MVVSGGGVLVAVPPNSLDSYVAPDLEADDCELLWVRIRLRGRRTLYVCAYYRPDVADEPSLTKLRTSPQRASGLPNAHRPTHRRGLQPPWLGLEHNDPETKDPITPHAP